MKTPYHQFYDPNKPKPSAAQIAARKAKYDNPWDHEISPLIDLSPQNVRHTNKRLSNVHFHLAKLASLNEMKVVIYRGRQLAYLQPYFQAMLDPSLKNGVYIATVGQKYWVIGAENGVLATRFKFQAKTIRMAMSQYLKREIPPFKIKVYPNSKLPQPIIIPQKRAKPAQLEQIFQDLSTSLKKHQSIKNNFQAHQTLSESSQNMPSSRLKSYLESVKNYSKTDNPKIDEKAQATEISQHASSSKMAEILAMLKSTP